MRYARLNPIALLAVLVTTTHASAINIVFDYSLDTNNFFNTQAKRDVMDAAAAVFEAFTDQLAAITPGTVYNQGTANQFSDTWTASFTHPGTGSSYTVNNLSIAADTILVYAGGRNLPGSTLGEGGPGGFTANGIQSFVDAVEGRGQAGALAPVPYDFGPWGGAITFDLFNDWNFDLNTAPANNETDFFSVAVHELAHLLGFGTATSFDVLANGTTFSGANATSVYGSNPTLNFDQMHWAPGTTSTLPGGGVQETAMDPDIADGAIKQFTLLDFAALKDIGWEVPASIFNSLDGDLNDDGFVGITDLNIVLGNWNQYVSSGDPLMGDPSGDGYVGIDDLNTVLGNWNNGTPPGQASLSVPEPVTVLWFTAMLLVHPARARRAFGHTRCA
ncbi:MAG: matrixin family metalloprotease [Phycisphaerales bacterium]